MNPLAQLNPWQLLTGVVALVLTAFWLTLGRSTQFIQPAEVDNPLDANFDYYISGMNRTTFSRDSVALHHLNAELVQHFPEDDRAVLVQPGFSWFENTNAPWQIKAANGELLRQSTVEADLLRLHGQVNLSKPLAPGDNLSIITANLAIDIAAKTFSTAEPVMLSSATMQLQSRGMSGQLETNHLELLNEVSGKHD